MAGDEATHEDSSPFKGVPGMSVLVGFMYFSHHGEVIDYDDWDEGRA